MEIRIIILHCLKIIYNFNLCVQFFLYLPDKRFLGCFARLDLAAGELPSVTVSTHN